MSKAQSEIVETWPDRLLEVRKMRAGDILPHPRNPKSHPASQQSHVKGLLNTVGKVDILRAYKSQRANGALVYFDGHCRELIDPDEQWSVGIYDIGDAEADVLVTAFDYTARGAEYQRDVLEELLQDIKESEALPVEDAALNELLAGLASEQGLEWGNDQQNTGVPGGDPQEVLNRAEQLKQQYGVERGQIWQCGRHRLMCGDSYSRADIEALLDGQKPAMLNTDPPYGISIVQPRNGARAADSGGSKPFGATSGAERKSGIAFRNAAHVHVQHGAPSRNQIIQSNMYPVIEGDDRPFEPERFLDFAPIVILWGANYYADKLPISSCWIVWDKREDITRNTFADCELAWCNQDKPARLFHHLWNGLHKGSQHGERRTHPTEKPIALFEEIGKMLCPEGLWVDLFAGTGAQIIAAERSGATCYAVDSEPLYIASALERLSTLSLSPRLEHG